MKHPTRVEILAEVKTSQILNNAQTLKAQVRVVSHFGHKNVEREDVSFEAKFKRDMVIVDWFEKVLAAKYVPKGHDSSHLVSQVTLEDKKLLLYHDSVYSSFDVLQQNVHELSEFDSREANAIANRHFGSRRATSKSRRKRALLCRVVQHARNRWLAKAWSYLQSLEPDLDEITALHRSRLSLAWRDLEYIEDSSCFSSANTSADLSIFSASFTADEKSYCRPQRRYPRRYMSRPVELLMRSMYRGRQIRLMRNVLKGWSLFATTQIQRKRLLHKCITSKRRSLLRCALREWYVPTLLAFRNCINGIYRHLRVVKQSTLERKQLSRYKKEVRSQSQTKGNVEKTTPRRIEAINSNVKVRGMRTVPSRSSDLLRPSPRCPRPPPQRSSKAMRKVWSTDSPYDMLMLSAWRKQALAVQRMHQRCSAVVEEDEDVSGHKENSGVETTNKNPSFTKSITPNTGTTIPMTKSSWGTVSSNRGSSRHRVWFECDDTLSTIALAIPTPPVQEPGTPSKESAAADPFLLTTPLHSISGGNSRKQRPKSEEQLNLMNHKKIEEMLAKAVEKAFVGFQEQLKQSEKSSSKKKKKKKKSKKRKSKSHKRNKSGLHERPQKTIVPRKTSISCVSKGSSSMATTTDKSSGMSGFLSNNSTPKWGERNKSKTNIKREEYLRRLDRALILKGLNRSTGATGLTLRQRYYASLGI